MTITRLFPFLSFLVHMWGVSSCTVYRGAASVHVSVSNYSSLTTLFGWVKQKGKNGKNGKKTVTVLNGKNTNQ